MRYKGTGHVDSQSVQQEIGLYWHFGASGEVWGKTASHANSGPFVAHGRDSDAGFFQSFSPPGRPNPVRPEASQGPAGCAHSKPPQGVESGLSGLRMCHPGLCLFEGTL